jgi:predicted O-methyltransferase YrrM
MNITEINSLTRKWQPVIDQASHIFSWTEWHCLGFLAELATRSKVGIEVGSYMGKSAFVMLKANPSLKLYCVDLFQKGVVGTLECCQYFMREEMAQGRVEFISASSREGADILAQRGIQADFAWIDGGHDTPTVLGDIRKYLPLIRPGGELLGHDFDQPPEHPEYNDVAQAVIASGIAYTVPVPRLWHHVKPE